MISSADRAARGTSCRYFIPVTREKSSGQASNARSWIVTIPGHGRRNGRKQLVTCTIAAPWRRKRTGSLSCSNRTSGPRPPSLKTSSSRPSAAPDRSASIRQRAYRPQPRGWGANASRPSIAISGAIWRGEGPRALPAGGPVAVAGRARHVGVGERPGEPREPAVVEREGVRREGNQQPAAGSGRAEVERAAEGEVRCPERHHAGPVPAGDLDRRIARAAVDHDRLGAPDPSLPGEQPEAAADRVGLIAGADDHADLEQARAKLRTGRNGSVGWRRRDCARTSRVGRSARGRGRPGRPTGV